MPLEGGRTLVRVREVTEPHQLEARFRAMADAAPIGIFMTDASGNCTYTNASWQRLFGLRAEQALGSGWSTALHPEGRASVFAEWARSAAAGMPFEMELRMQPVPEALSLALEP